MTTEITQNSILAAGQPNPLFAAECYRKKRSRNCGNDIQYRAGLCAVFAVGLARMFEGRLQLLSECRFCFVIAALMTRGLSKGTVGASAFDD